MESWSWLRFVVVVVAEEANVQVVAVAVVRYLRMHRVLNLKEEETLIRSGEVEDCEAGYVQPSSATSCSKDARHDCRGIRRFDIPCQSDTLSWRT